MATAFEKLNWKGQNPILVLNAPSTFEAEIAHLHGVEVLRDAKEVQAVHFALAFAVKQTEVDALVQALCPKAVGDALLWFAYPKISSRNYTCDFNRDTGWAAIRAAGFDSVRQIAIDEDWSALRFRRTEYSRSSDKKTTPTSASTR